MTSEKLRLEKLKRAYSRAAFPAGDDTAHGLTKLEYMSALALHGLLSNPDPELLRSPDRTIAGSAIFHAQELIAELAELNSSSDSQAL